MELVEIIEGGNKSEDGNLFTGKSEKIHVRLTVSRSNGIG